MPTAQIPINEGLLTGADPQSATTQSLTNFMVDEAGVNRVRPGVSTTSTFDGFGPIGTDPVIGATFYKSPVNNTEYIVLVCQSRAIYAAQSVAPFGSLLTLSSSDMSTKLSGMARPVFAEDSQRLVIAGGGELQQWTGSGLTSRLSPNVDPITNDPPNASHVLSVANYLVANDTRPGFGNKFAWSDLGDGNHTSWPPLNYSSADARPDPIVAAYENLREVWLMGSTTLQVMGIVGDPLLPFQPISTINLGCGAPYSPVRMDESFAWLDERRRFVYSNGRSYEIVSSPISRTIQDMTTVSDCWGFRAAIGFWDLIIWVFPTEKTALAYDWKAKKWFPWREWNGVDDWKQWTSTAYVYWASQNLHVLGRPAGGLGSMSMSFSRDENQYIVAERITGQLDWGSDKRKRCNCVRFFLRRGTGAFPSGPQGYLEVRKQDDGGHWSEWRLLDLGIAGDYTNWVDWYPGGVYRRRAYHIRFTPKVDLAIAAAEETYDLLDS